MSTKVEATIEDLYKVEGKAELVNGEIVLHAAYRRLSSPMLPGKFFFLRAYEKTIRNGYAIGDNAAFIVNLPHRKSFSPDAGFYIGDITMKFFEGAPCLPLRFVAKVTMDQALNERWRRNVLITSPQVLSSFGTSIC